MDRLLKALEQQCNRQHIGDLDLVVGFVCPSGELRVRLSKPTVDFFEASSLTAPEVPQPELILHFSSEQCALDILQGRYSPIDAFMQEDFRSNGYIMWAFQCLAVFSTAA